MATNNGGSLAGSEWIQAVLEIIEELDTLKRVESTRRAIAGRTMEYLLIGGKSLLDIMFVSPISWFTKLTITSEGDEYSDEEHELLLRHIEQKRPHFVKLLRSLWKTGRLRADTDFNAIGAQVQQALALDQAEAALDDCVWASMEWKWQKYETPEK